MTQATQQETQPESQRGATPATRPTHGTDAALRLSVLGPVGRADLVAPYGTTVAELAASYAAAVGLDVEQAPSLTLPDGKGLDPAADVDDVLEQGALVVARGEAPATADAEPVAPAWGAEATSLAGASTVPVLVLAGAAALAAAVLAAAGTGASAATWLRPTSAGVLLLGALAVAFHAAVRGTSGSHAYAAAPALAGAAGFALAWSPGAGGVLLGLAVAGLSVCVVAAAARSGAGPAGGQVLRSWLLIGAVASATAVLWLLVGAGLLAFACVALAVAVVACRMLPGFAVDVDDDVLLDLDRLAVTAWSARETPRGGRRRHQVRLSVVQELVAGSRRSVNAGVVVAVATAAVAAPAVVSGAGADPTTWAALGGLAMVALGGASMALVARGYRSPLPRLLLGATSCWLLLLAGTALAVVLDDRWLWWGFGVLVVAVPAVVLSAVRLGGGWRSVWWSRIGEALQTLTGVVVVALVPLASGLFDLVRTSFG